MKAIKYRKPAKVRGGISLSPSLIITNDVDQRKVTSSASKIAVVREIGLEKIKSSLTIIFQKIILMRIQKEKPQIFFLAFLPEDL